jgi:serine/threonine protein kinase
MDLDLDDIREELDELRERCADEEFSREELKKREARLCDGLSIDEKVRLGVSTELESRSSGYRIGPGKMPTQGPTELASFNIVPGKRLKEWEIIRELGRGGFGAVFKARQVQLKKTYAVKVLEPALVQQEDQLERFRREVVFMQELSHKHIAKVFGYHEDLEHGLVFISMEYVKGCSTRELLAEARSSQRTSTPGLIPLPLVFAIMHQTLQALASVHSDGLIHRDVTPGNILLAGGKAMNLLEEPHRDPEVKLVDFGIAALAKRKRVTQKNRVLGVAAYLAPEVLDDEAKPTDRVDIFGVGAVVYELLCGKPPAARSYKPIRDLCPGMPHGLAEVVTSCIDIDPQERPDAEAALDLLEEAERKYREVEQLRKDLEEAISDGDESAAHGTVIALKEALGSDAVSDVSVRDGQAWLTQREQEEARRTAEIRLSEKEDELRNAEERFSEIKDELQNVKEKLQESEDDLRNRRQALEQTEDELRGTRQVLGQTEDELHNTKETLEQTEIQLARSKQRTKRLLLLAIPLTAAATLIASWFLPQKPNGGPPDPKTTPTATPQKTPTPHLVLVHSPVATVLDPISTPSPSTENGVVPGSTDEPTHTPTPVPTEVPTAIPTVRPTPTASVAVTRRGHSCETSYPCFSDELLVDELRKLQITTDTEHFAAKAIEHVYGVGDFVDGESYLESRKVVSYVKSSPHWQRIEIKDADEVADNGRAVVAVKEGSFVAVIIPGEPKYSSKWGGKVPCAAFSSEAKSLVGCSLNWAFSKQGVEVYARNEPATSSD